MLDLDAYLARIGLRGRPSLREAHRAHVTSIPFENLDPRAGVPVSLAPEDLEHKLVSERRGGYCFEQNLLFKGAAEALGAHVDLLLARVRLGGNDRPRPRSHLVLRVESDGATWLTDVGFGVGTLLEPVPFGIGGPYDQAGWRYRLVADDDELVLQAEGEAGWEDQFAFPDQPVPLVDVEVSNWFTSTHPRSPFVTGLIVASTTEDGRRLTLSDWDGLAFTESAPGHRVRTPVEWAQVPLLLEERFGLPGCPRAEPLVNRESPAVPETLVPDRS